MSRRPTLRAVLATAALALFALPAAASASPSALPLPLLPGIPPKALATVETRSSPIETPSSPEPRPEFEHLVRLHARGGYEVEVIGTGNFVALEVGHKHGHAATAYVVKGTVTGSRLQADFGAFGKLSLRFHPGKSRHSVHRKHFCGGVPLKVDHEGVYTGSVQFTGEGGYVSVDARRGRGKITRFASECGPLRLHRSSSASASASGPKLKETSRPRALFAFWRHGGQSVEFGGFTFFGKTLYLVETAQTEGRLAIERFAMDTAPLRTFALDETLTSSHVSPRKPFIGTGTYSAAPDGSIAWEGSLAVNFPGAPAFPLTGPQFEAELETGF